MGLKSLDYITPIVAPGSDNSKYKSTVGSHTDFFLKEQRGQVGRKVLVTILLLWLKTPEANG